MIQARTVRLMLKEAWAQAGEARGLRKTGAKTFVEKIGDWRVRWELGLVGSVLISDQSVLWLCHESVARLIKAALRERWPEVSGHYPLVQIDIKAGRLDTLALDQSSVEAAVSAWVDEWWRQAEQARIAIDRLKASRKAYAAFLEKSDWPAVWRPYIEFLLLLGADPETAWRRCSGGEKVFDGQFFEWCDRNRRATEAVAAKLNNDLG